MTVSAESFPIEKVRAAFPALEREVHGQPVASLDSGAVTVALLFLGPGAYSVDARLFGRREIVIPRRSR